jgi:sulfopropanediol 3-dehydrogenase
MTREYLKKATLTSASGASDVHETVVGILSDIEQGGDAKAIEYAAKFDRYEGSVLLSAEEIEAACALVPEKLTSGLPTTTSNALPNCKKARLPTSKWKLHPAIWQGKKASP